MHRVEEIIKYSACIKVTESKASPAQNRKRNDKFQNCIYVKNLILNSKVKVAHNPGCFVGNTLEFRT